MSLATRGLIGLGAIGSAVGGGYALTYAFSKDNIGSKLEANGYQLLSKDANNNEFWTEILKSYTAVVGSNSSLKFDSFAGGDSTSNQDLMQQLQEHCEKSLKKRITEDNEKKEIYKRTEKWCTKPIEVSKRLDWLGFKALDVDQNKDTQVDEWNSKLNKYKDAKKTKQPTFPTGLTDNVDADNRNKIKKACEVPLKKKTYEADYETSLENAKEWCSVKKDKQTT
ncbi:hypothetical protein A6V39_00070 [Candidatus Mycoplasma haematobovis]|uniref:Uncharacterized protein n=1 Tax=Candidatus Mycoplasma haematobovis TaxID=432608 RepID=A0A1A9QE92_9MOLU|nr:hypothetical protein [Candidatus Mycoplasma haematobovis]OAL10444.1 hypothetical protein A6V39_00070 [Candidatus Mycoplasma haematobovis]